MNKLSELAERAVTQPVAQPSSIDVLHRRADQRRRAARAQRAGLAAAILVPVLALGAFVGLGADVTGRDSVGTSAEAGDVFGHELADGEAVWPADPMPLDALLDAIATDLLRWPIVEWGENEQVGSTRVAYALHPDNPDRRLPFELVESAQGWQIASASWQASYTLDVGDLSGFAVPHVLAEVDHVEAWYRDPVDGTQFRVDVTHRFVAVSEEVEELGIGPTLEVELSEPIPPGRSGTWLVVGRDANGAAVVVYGQALGSPDRLSVAIDQLLDAGSPQPVPSWFTEEPFLTLDFVVPDWDRSVVVAGISEGADLYVVPSLDDANVCLFDFRGGHAGGGCPDGLGFNQNGWVGSSLTGVEGEPPEGYTLLVLPDTIEFSPELAPLAQANGRVVVLPLDRKDNTFEVVDGVMTEFP